MPQFKDINGKFWDISITVATLKRVKRLANVDLMELADLQKPLPQAIMVDPIALVNVLYAVCEPQATRDGVTDDAFAGLLAGDSIALATDALLDAFVDFCQDATIRASLRRVQESRRRVRTKAMAMLDRSTSPEVLERLEAEQLAGIEAQLRKISGGPSGAPPASSESPLGTSPSAS